MRATLAHYRILAKLGEGGMGEVWKAQDTRLDRVVALKILRADKVADADRKRRFVQEAKTASSLNHPHIVTIHEIGSDDGVDYIAMEYVSGQTLDQWIRRGRVPIKQAIEWAIQIASALSAAHSRGIVHRDIKPGNVMVSEDLGVKVLDFGLSKLLEPVAGGDQTATATMTEAPRTEEGKLVGTVAYMSPEQAEGQSVDARSDIFSFGALLYELVAGRRAFTGGSKVSLLAAILREEPAPVSSIASGVPPDLERIIALCLRKDPARRYQHVADVRIALEDLKEESESGVRQAATAKTSKRSWVWLAAGALGVAAIAISLWAWLHRPESEVGPALTRLTQDTGLTTDPALSPDGRLLAYASDRAGQGSLDLWVQQLGGGDPTRITDRPEDEYEPQFSPDGTRIAYRSEAAGGGIYTISALGGQARLIAPNGRGPRYSPDGKQIAFWKGSPTNGSPWSAGAATIWVANADGGSARQLAADFQVAARPEWTSDGRHIAFEGLSKNDDFGDCWVIPLEGGAAVRTGLAKEALRRKLEPSAAYPAAARGLANRFYVPLALHDAVNLWSFELSPRTWKLDGPLRRLTFGTQSEVQPSVAGARIAFTAVSDTYQVWSVSLDANRGAVRSAPELLTHDGISGQPSLSRDGRKLLYWNSRGGEERAILRDLASSTETVLAGARTIHVPLLSPDGERITYRTGNRETMVAPSSGGVAQKVCDSCGTDTGWSADGRVLFVEHHGIGVLELPGAGRTSLLAHPKYPMWQAQTSADNQWVSFLVARDAEHKSIHVAPFRPGVSPENWITVAAANTENDKPRWSPDGQMIYFTSMRDGFRCIWAQRLNPATKVPTGEAFAVIHFHSTVRSISNVPLFVAEIAVASDRLAFVLGERHGNIWLVQAR